MANKKNQHFVPQYFFRNFSTDKKRIGVLLRDNGKIIKMAPIKGQCSKNNFYGSIEVEDLFSKIEREHSAILRKILSLKSKKEYIGYYNNSDKENPEININPDILILLQSILFQKSRTELEANKHREMFGNIVKEMLVREMELQGETNIIKYKDYFSIDVDMARTVLMMIKTSAELVDQILDLGIYILKNKTDIKFIFSDSPVIFYNRYYKNVRLHGVLGLQTPGLMIFYPIAHDTCILLLDESVYNGSLMGNHFFEIENEHDITSINKLQLHHSLNAIYYSEDIDLRYIKRLWRQQRSSLKQVGTNFITAPAINHDGISMGDIMHSFEPQIPYMLNLSFLSSDILDDSKYIFRYRTPELAKEAKRRFP